MLDSIRKAVRFPEAAKRKAAAALVRPFISRSFPSGSHVASDWDTLVIIDACRYDTFLKYNPFDEPVVKACSNASHTMDFLSRNLLGDQSDTVYITASPQVTKVESRFHEVVHVWHDDWNAELRTVLPGSVTAAALDAHARFPDKKLIIHYMQPHYPFIGPTGRELDTHATFTGGLRQRERLSIWEMLSSGSVDRSTVVTAYEENLELVLDDVVTLVDKLDGKTVLTSDHGNLFGERVSPLPIKLYGHPSNVPTENLVTVPLVELPFSERRSITEGTSNHVDSDTTDVESRLEDLGYL